MHSALGLVLPDTDGSLWQEKNTITGSQQPHKYPLPAHTPLTLEEERLACKWGAFA